MKKRAIDGLFVVAAIVLASLIYAKIQKTQAQKEAKKIAGASTPKVDGQG